MNIKNLIEQSINWRRNNFDDSITNAYRLFSGISDGIEGLLIDRWDKFILVTLYNDKLVEHKQLILSTLETLFPENSILMKARGVGGNDNFDYSTSVNYQKEDVFYCIEEKLKYEIHVDPRHDYGLYLDTKSARKFLADICKGKNVLNLFAYTCPFGVSAMCSDASSVTNIDPNKDYLSWGGQNAELNNIMFKKYPDTTQDYLKRHLKRLESGKDDPYDIIVVDPPAFLVGRGSNRLARNLWPTWMNQLKESQCNEFIVVINDKSFARQTNLETFLKDGLGEELKVSIIDQSMDIKGQQLSSSDDKFYFNPIVFHLKH